MKRAVAFLIATSAISVTGSQALAQDGYALPPPPPPVVAPYPDGPVVHPQPMPGMQHHGAVMTHPGAHYAEGPGLPPMPSVGYTRDERDAWLADCRATYYGEGRRTGGIIGSLIGAVGGGILGHEIVDGNRTRRIGGTLIGAGVGGLAGLAIGAAIGAAGDRDERIDECEAYLRRWQGGYLPGHGYGYGYGHYGYTTVMVPVQVQRGYSYSAPIEREEEYVTEEVIEERVVVPAKTTKYVKTAPAPTKYVKGKTVRSVK